MIRIHVKEFFFQLKKLCLEQLSGIHNPAWDWTTKPVGTKPPYLTSGPHPQDYSCGEAEFKNIYVFMDTSH